jgi:hypothetical protein
MAYDVARGGTAKPQHGPGDFIRPSNTADWDCACHLGIRLWVAVHDIAGDLCVDRAGVDRVHADTLLGVFERGRPCQTDHAVLGGDVGSEEDDLYSSTLVKRVIVIRHPELTRREPGHASEAAAINLGFGIREVFINVRPENPKPGKCMNL